MQLALSVAGCNSQLILKNQNKKGINLAVAHCQNKIGTLQCQVTHMNIYPQAMLHQANSAKQWLMTQQPSFFLFFFKARTAPGRRLVPYPSY